MALDGTIYVASLLILLAHGKDPLLSEHLSQPWGLH